MSYDAKIHTADGLVFAADRDFIEGLIKMMKPTSEKGEGMCKKAMISQPMEGKTNEEIIKVHDKAIAKLNEMGYEVVNTYFSHEWYSDDVMENSGIVHIQLRYLARSLENMGTCHTVYFCKGWENARGCRIEHEAAVAYGLEVLYEN